MILVIGLTVIVTLSVIWVMLFALRMTLKAKRHQIMEHFPDLERGGALMAIQKRRYEWEIKEDEKKIKQRDEKIAELIEDQKREWSRQSKSYTLEQLSLNQPTTKG